VKVEALVIEDNAEDTVPMAEPVAVVISEAVNEACAEDDVESVI
jgi:hypothetical protein